MADQMPAFFGPIEKGAVESEIQSDRLRHQRPAIPGIRTIAVPLKGARGEVVAALGITGSQARMTKPKLRACAIALRQVARERIPWPATSASVSPQSANASMSNDRV